MSDRRRYQREVERLLEQIRAEVRELRRLYAVGARGPALADLKSDLAGARRELARVVSGGQRETASA